MSQKTLPPAPDQITASDLAAHGAVPPQTPAEAEVYARIQAYDQAIAATQQLPALATAEPAQLPLYRAQWFGRAPQLCDATATMVQGSDRFAQTPITANLIRLRLLETGRADYLARLRQTEADEARVNLVVRRAETMDLCAKAFQHGEAPLHQPFASAQEQEAAQRLTGPVRGLNQERTDARLRAQRDNERVAEGYQGQVDEATQRAQAAADLAEAALAGKAPQGKLGATPAAPAPKARRRPGRGR